MEGERDKDNCPLSYFNLDVQGPEFFRVEAIISHVTCHSCEEPGFFKGKVQEVTVSVLKCFKF